jgi:predicted RNA binding protein YcfA (HicA-like mRNA interferase family)
MTSADKTLARMRDNPRDWRIADLQAVAKRHGMNWEQAGTSHVTFRAPDGGKVTVPARKPIKPVYVRLFIALIDSLGAEGDEQT